MRVTVLKTFVVATSSGMVVGNPGEEIDISDEVFATLEFGSYVAAGDAIPTAESSVLDHLKGPLKQLALVLPTLSLADVEQLLEAERASAKPRAGHIKAIEAAAAMKADEAKDPVSADEGGDDDEDDADTDEGGEGTGQLPDDHEAPAA